MTNKFTQFFRIVAKEMNDAEVALEAEEVKKLVLENPGLTIDESRYYKNGYNAPGATENIRNEVWWVKP